MTFLRFMCEFYKIFALGIVLSLCMQLDAMQEPEAIENTENIENKPCNMITAQGENVNCDTTAVQNAVSAQENITTQEKNNASQENAVSQDDDTKGCGCGSKPKPRPNVRPTARPKPNATSEPNPKEVITNLISDIVCDACDSECSGELPEPIRRSYQRAEQRMLTTNDVLYAMPTLMRYALEHMRNATDSRTQKAQRYVKALMSYMEKHVETMQSHSARQEIMDMLEHSTQDLQNYAPLAKRMQYIMERMTEVSSRSIYRDEPTRGCCSSACTTIPLEPPVGLPSFRITETGNYCLVADVAANIIIDVANTSLDLNDRTLTGWVLVNAPNVTVKNGKIFPPTPLTDPEANIPAVEVSTNAKNTRLCCLVIECENSVGRDPNQSLPSGTALHGRGGILNGGEKTIISDCCITSGAGASGNILDTLPPFDNGGNGGFGIQSFGVKAQISNCLIMTGSGGSGSPVCICAINGPAGGNGGNGIGVTGENTCVSDCKIITGNGGNGGLSCCEAGGNGGHGGNGIFNNRHSTQITNCSIQTGNGGLGGEGDAGNDVSGGQGGNGGHGIVTNGTLITANVIATGNGGDGGDGGNPATQVPPASKGGNGGHGILVDINACNTKIQNNIIDRTGRGGNGGDSKTPLGGANGDGGNGGDGIFINLLNNGGPGSEAQTTEARLNTISNTGRGGLPGTTALATPGTAGQDGRAITDLNNDATSTDPACPATDNQARSIIYSNFAYAIGNTTIRYLLNGVNAEGGVNVTTPPTFFDNVYAA